MVHDTLGYVTVATAGTPVQAVAGTAYATKSQKCHGIMVEALPGNTGLTYVGQQGFDKDTGAGVLAIIGAPSGDPTNFLPTFSAAVTLAPNALSLSDYWVDADENGDGVLFTLLIL